MVGIFGAESTDGAELLSDGMTSRERCETERFDDGAFHFGIHHHSDTDLLTSVRESGNATGAIYGTYYGEPVERTDTDAELLRTILSEPASVLPEMDGSFVVVGSDPEEDRLLLATDKLATRPVYCATNPYVQFSSKLSPFTDTISDPNLDLEAIGDIVSTSFVWGNKTLLEDVSALPAASYMELSADGTSVERYWDGEYLDVSDDEYVRDVLSQFQAAVLPSIESLSGTIGLNLSGGLDSRLQAGVLAEEVTDLETFTFDANPGGSANLEPARQIARTLDVSNRQTDFEPDEFAEVLDVGVDLTDGMVPWTNYHNLPFVLSELSNAVDTLVKGMGQGEIFGDYLRANDLNRANDTSPAESLANFFGDPSMERLFAFDFDLEESMAEAVAASTGRRDRRLKMQDTIRNNFYPNFHYRADRIDAHTLPTVDVLPNGELLSMAQSMPDRFRRRIRRVLGKGIDDPMSPLKYRLVREWDDGLEKIPYERTGIPVNYPYAFHFLQYNARLAVEQYFRPQPPGMYATWIRDDPTLRSLVEDLIDSAADRPFFDGDAIETVRREHFAEESNWIEAISRVTTIELWLQNNHDL